MDEFNMSLIVTPCACRMPSGQPLSQDEQLKRTDAAGLDITMAV
jgi:hypothetical protein